MADRLAEEKDIKRGSLRSLEDYWKRKRGKMEKDKETSKIEAAFRKSNKVLWFSGRGREIGGDGEEEIEEKDVGKGG